MKNHYECTFIINPVLDDTQIENTIKSIEEMIAKNGGVIVATDRIGRRRLAYPIAKKHNGFYVCTDFEAEGSAIERIERYLTLEENVMRYLTIKLDKRQLAAKTSRAAGGTVIAGQKAE
ncbi:MAG: 30S ribosomal protein S6 [Bacteroidota bacterium]|nr:30S ribosomal protein S6 [Bacteroidota bacterium]